MSPKLLNILLILLPVTLYLGFIKPYYTGEEGLVWAPEKSIKLLQIEKTQYEDTLNQISLIKDAADKLNKEYLAVDQETKDKVYTMLPDTVDTVKLRNEILVMGADSGIAIDGLSIEKDQKGDKGLGFYKISFSVRARYSTFKDFMEKYERSKRFFILEQAAISRPDIEGLTPAQAQAQEGLLNISIISRLYYIK